MNYTDCDIDPEKNHEDGEAAFLAAIKLQSESDPQMPVCPYCKAEMKPFDYHGYYDSFFGWECKCDKIPGAEKQCGQYA